MKLLIKKKYFDVIKSGEKNLEWRDAHITFICEETKEELRKDVIGVGIVPVNYLRSTKRMTDEEISELFTDKKQIYFKLGGDENGKISKKSRRV